VLFLLESSVDYPKESDGTINQSGKLNFFFFEMPKLDINNDVIKLCGWMIFNGRKMYGIPIG